MLASAGCVGAVKGWRTEVIDGGAPGRDRHVAEADNVAIVALVAASVRIERIPAPAQTARPGRKV
jgi:hypothetical protein